MKNVFLLRGKDEYLLQLKTKEILDNLNIDSEIVEDYDLDEGNMQDLIGNLSTISVFDDARVFLLKNPDALTNNSMDKADVEAFRKYLEGNIEGSYLIITSSNYDKENSLNDLLKKYAEIYDLDSKKGMSQEDYLKEYINKNNLKIDQKAKDELLKRSPDFKSLENNLIKVDCYSNGELITIDTINLLIAVDLDEQVYHITEAIIQKNTSRAYKLFSEMIKNNVPSQVIFKSLTNKFTLLLYVSKLMKMGNSKDDIANKLGMKNSGQVYYLMNDVKALGEERIYNYLNKLQNINLMSRNGSGDELTLLELFILEK